MRKLLLAGALMAGSSMAAEMTGWISDSSCGAGNASSAASARSCAERCIKSGSVPVFVSERDKKVYKLADGAAAAQHLKGKVKVTGTVHGDTLTLTAITDAGS